MEAIKILNNLPQKLPCATTLNDGAMSKEHAKQIEESTTNLGVLSSLTTTIRTSIVHAINSLVSALTTHKTSNDHDGRYYTETEIDNKLSWVSNAPSPNGYGGSVTGYLRKFGAQAFCIVGLNITTGTAVTSAGTYAVAMVAGSLPITITALSCRCITTAINTGIGAYIGSDGVIKITTSVDIPAGTAITISGVYCF